MTSPLLSSKAFLPKRPLSASERQTLIANRNRLFSMCKPAEQILLSELAIWLEAVRLEVFQKPNLFSECDRICLYYRLFPWANPRPNFVVFGLSRIQRAVLKVERWLGVRAQRKLSSRIRSLQHSDNAESLVAVVLFLRSLPPDFGPVEKPLLEAEFDTLLGESLHNLRISAVQRFDALVRCAMWSYDGNQYVMHDIGLRKHAWPLLLEVARRTCLPP